MATTTEPSSIRGAIRLPAGRIGVRGGAFGIAVSAIGAIAIGLLMNAEFAAVLQSGLLAGICVTLGVAFGVGLIAAAGRVDPFGAAMLTLLSTIILMSTAIAIAFTIQIAIEPLPAPFWLGLAGGCGAAMWAMIMTTLPILGSSDEGL